VRRKNGGGFALKIDIRESARNAARGAGIGASMLIPGVSGGTTAVALGIYDKLISSASALFKKSGRNLAFLLPVALGGLAGVSLFAGPLATLLERRFVSMMGLFSGMVIGSFPLFFRRAAIKRDVKGLSLAFFFVAAGASLAYVFALLPEGLFVPAGQSPLGYLFVFAAGVLLSAGLILPGISVSHMLLVLGLHDELLRAIEDVDVRFLVALGLGITAGTAACVRALERAMTRFPAAVFPLVAGFAAASLADVLINRVLPLRPAPAEIIQALLLLTAGALAARLLGGGFKER